MKPTVGRIVHFYNPGGPSYNGQGAGPYAAIVTQTFPDADGTVRYANLKLFLPFSAIIDHGSVPEKDTQFHHPGGCYWEWPPRE